MDVWGGGVNEHTRIIFCGTLCIPIDEPFASSAGELGCGSERFLCWEQGFCAGTCFVAFVNEPDGDVGFYPFNGFREFLELVFSRISECNVQRFSCAL